MRTARSSHAQEYKQCLQHPAADLGNLRHRRRFGRAHAETERCAASVTCTLENRGKSERQVEQETPAHAPAPGYSRIW